MAGDPGASPAPPAFDPELDDFLASAPEFSRTSAEYGPAAGQAAPRRILLRRVVGTEEQRHQRASASGLIRVYIAAVLAGPAVLSARQSAATWAIVAVGLLAVYACFYWLKLREPGAEPYEDDAWLDFAQRCWRQRKRYAQQALPTSSDSVPFERLGLACSAEHIGDGETYLVALYRVDPAQPIVHRGHAGVLSRLHWCDSEAAALDLVKLLAARWGFPAWHVDAGPQRSTIRLC